MGRGETKLGTCVSCVSGTDEGRVVLGRAGQGVEWVFVSGIPDPVCLYGGDDCDDGSSALIIIPLATT